MHPQHLRNKTHKSVKVAFLGSHPSPYLNPTLERVFKHRDIDIEVLFLFDICSRHSYWDLGPPPFEYRVLPGGNLQNHSHSYPAIIGDLAQGLYDVVCINGYHYRTLRLALAYCLLSRTPFVWGGDSTLKSRRSVWRWVLRWLPNWLIMHAAGAFWVPGQAAEEHMVYYGAPPERVFQGCYCLDVKTLVAKAERMEEQGTNVRESLGVVDDQMIFLFVGEMIPRRGLRYLLKAFKEVVNFHSKLALVLIGHGPERSWIETFIDTNELTQVRVLDPVPFQKLLKYYVASDCYIHPSLEEPYSLAVKEAAALGLPLIVSENVGAASDFLIDGETGFLAKAADTSSLARAINSIIDHRDRMEAMGQKAQRIALTRNSDWAADQLSSAILAALDSG